MKQSFRKRISHCLMLAVLVAVAFLGGILSTHVAHAAHAATGALISPTDPNINYVGRWDTSSSSVAISYWSGAYFRTDFTGTTVKIQLAIAANIWVTIDGGKDVRYGKAKGTINLTPTPLAAGTHSLRVAAERETDLIHLQGITLDAGAKTIAPPTTSQLIEFVGDSISAGGGPKMTEGALSSYPWLIGERLSMEHTQVAQGSICLVDKVPCGAPNGIGMSKQYFKLQTVAYPNSPNWDFSRYQANAVVINLGTNDGRNSGITAATFQSTYITFIKSIRAKFPHALIFVVRPFGGYFAAPTKAAAQAVMAAGDTNVRYIDTTGWLNSSDLTDLLHPSVAGHIKVSNLMEPIIASALGIFPVNPATTYKLVNHKSGQVIDLSGSAMVQQPAHSSTTQEWKLTPVGNGFYKLINVSSHKLLQEPTSGTQLVQGTDTNSSNQWWKIQATSGYYALVNERDGLSVDVQNQSTTQGAAVIRSATSSATSQQWQLTVV
jgi:GDSL-like Lipase/Acylhydrolase family/Carbohydrate esterase 2 N-terminal/Ricin-type beta-trefoil lectin domain-like